MTDAKIIINKRDRSPIGKFFFYCYQYKALLLMLLPGFIVFFVNYYIPIFGIVIAFKKIDFALGILKSPFVGLENFRFLFSTTDAWRITRNTILYNAIFIVCDVIFAIIVAMLMREIWQPIASKLYQTLIILPNFLSMVVVAYLVYGFLHPELGYLNSIITFFGGDAVKWYNEPKFWPIILPLVHWWKQIGFKSVIYLAAIAGLDKELYDVAVIDGAGKWQQAIYITLPQLSPTVVIMFLLALGNIFRADFGLFYQVTMNSAMIYEVTDVIDTYVYRALIMMNNIGMSSAASVYQSIIGAIMVISANAVIRKIDKSQAFF